MVTGGMITKGTVTKAWDLAVRVGRGEGGLEVLVAHGEPEKSARDILSQYI